MNDPKVLRHLKVPTGDIVIIEGTKDKRPLEVLCIGDYGKGQNIKADFLGYTEEINGVPHGELLPFEEKMVITLSTQYGCSMNCTFCDVPKVGPGVNATEEDMKLQILAALDLHPELMECQRLNVHFARMGEPTFNKDVLSVTTSLFMLQDERIKVHPVVSTMMPKRNKDLIKFLQMWCHIKNNIFEGEAGLQFSINSTDNDQREQMFSGSSLTLESIAKIVDDLPMPKGRKYTLNFALTSDSIIDAGRLRELFSPEKCMVKLTPMHITEKVAATMDVEPDWYTKYVPYQQVEADLKSEGFDVLVFIPSVEEDDGRITCGNAILSGSTPECKFTEVKA